MDKKYLIIISLIIFSSALFASRNASLNISFSIPEIQTITLNASHLNFNLMFTGNQSNPQYPYEPHIETISYNITSTSANPKRLLASLNQNMPTNVSLEVNAQAPTGANSMGFVPLDSSVKPLVTGIKSVNEPGRLMYFRLSATLGAQVATNENRTITFTISD